MFRNAGAVVIRIQIALFEVQAQAADLGSLREGADGCGRPRGQVKARTLGFGAHFIRALALAVPGSDGRQTFFHRRVMHARRVTARLDRRAPVGNRCRVAAVQRVAQQSQLLTLLQGKGKPAFHLRVESGLHAQVDRAVQQGTGRGYPQFTFTDNVLNLCIFLGEIGTPDVTTIHQTGREQPLRRQTLVQLCHIVFAVNEINVQTLNRQRGNGVEVRRYALEIGGQQQLHLARERVIRRFEGIQPRLRQLKHQRRFIDLHPLNTALTQLNQHLLINRQNIVQQAEAVELLAFHFAQPQVGDRPQQHGFHLVTQRQRFVHFIQKLGPGQFELLALNELRHHIVIVSVKPLGHFRRCRWLTRWRAATADAEQGIDIHRSIVVLMTSRHVAKQQAGGQNMVVPGEIAHRQQIYARLFLLIPVTRAQLAPHRQQFFAGGVTRPVAFLRFFQLATQANARETESVSADCHGIPLVEIRYLDVQMFTLL